MHILYEDSQLVAAEKPVGMLSEPAGSGENDMGSALAQQLGMALLPVHRLDRSTGGAMVFAKTRSAADKLSELIRQRAMEKEYLAVVHGTPEPEGIWTDLLFRDSAHNKTFVVRRLRKGVREAKLAYRLLQTVQLPNGAASLVRIQLYTGRTHQIRAQFAARKMPLLGDGKYGSRDNRCDTALWCCRLAFRHPFTGKPIEVKSAPPAIYPWDLFSRTY